MRRRARCGLRAQGFGAGLRHAGQRAELLRGLQRRCRAGAAATRTVPAAGASSRSAGSARARRRPRPPRNRAGRRASGRRSTRPGAARAPFSSRRRLLEHVQLQRAAQAAVVAGVGDQQVVLAVQVERGEVFPIGLGRRLRRERRQPRAALAHREQARGVAAVVDAATARRGWRREAASPLISSSCAIDQQPPTAARPAAPRLRSAASARPAASEATGYASGAAAGVVERRSCRQHRMHAARARQPRPAARVACRATLPDKLCAPRTGTLA